jgi:hypothetical protein
MLIVLGAMLLIPTLVRYVRSRHKPARDA